MTRTYRSAAASLILEHGTDEQRERLQANVLPDEERDSIVRDLLYLPIADLPRWATVDKFEIREHALSKRLAKIEDAVVMGSWPADSVTADEWALRKRIFLSLSEHLHQLLVNDVCLMTIENLWLVATCGAYEERYTKFKITITWHDVQFVREVAT